MRGPAQNETARHISIVKKAFPSITNEIYIRRLLSHFRNSGPSASPLEATLLFLLRETESSADSSSHKAWVTPFEIMSTTLPPPISTQYHNLSFKYLVHKYPQVPNDIILYALTRNRNLLLPALQDLTFHLEIDPDQHLVYFHDMQGSEQRRGVIPAPPLPEGPRTPSVNHFVTDVKRNNNDPSTLKLWHDKLAKQTRPFEDTDKEGESRLPAIPELSFLPFCPPPRTGTTSTTTCMKCYTTDIPIEFSCECINGHPLCSTCVSQLAGEGKYECPFCNTPYTHAVLSRYLSADAKKKYFKEKIVPRIERVTHAALYLSCGFPVDTVQSGICPMCYFPLEAAEEEHLWKCTQHGYFYLI